MILLEVIEGDITRVAADAIVNAANSSLLGGGGVDGAIHRAAGPDLLKECRGLGGCETGMAKITAGYLLPARYVIHTVGPVWHGGQQGEDRLLESCYRQCLQLASEHGLAHIVFPSISTGVYRFPCERASRLAVRTCRTFESDNDHPQRVTFCCYSAADASIYTRILENSE